MNTLECLQNGQEMTEASQAEMVANVRVIKDR
jgi:hypothetical protein